MLLERNCRLSEMPKLRFPGMSLIAWVAFTIGVVIVIFSFAHSKDYQLLAIAIPMLAALVIIPMVLTRMSQNAYSDATLLYKKKAKLQKISDINLSKVGEAVKVRGIIKNISMRWLNRPRLTINDNTGMISAVLFTAASEKLMVGERVEVLGLVMRGFIHRGSLSISTVGIKKLETLSE